MAEEFVDRDLRDAVFRDCAMARAGFEDVALSGACFADVDLREARFENVDMTDVTIDNARIDGLTVRGHDLAFLIETAGAAGRMIAEPQLFVSDMASSLAFYRDRLGFAMNFAWGEPVFYAQIARGGWRLNLRLVRGPVFDPGFREREEDALSATLILDDAEPIFAEYEHAGLQFHQRLRTEAWGAQTFIVSDPDGNLIAFAGRHKAE